MVKPLNLLSASPTGLGGGTPHFSRDLASLSPGARATSPAGQLQSPVCGPMLMFGPVPRSRSVSRCR